MSDASWSKATAEQAAAKLGLLPSEFEYIVADLGRLPNVTELTIFAAMWSEHCAYKSTRQWLGTMPKESPVVLAGPGAHAGVVDVGEGYAVAFKIESHNHPSAVEPYQGAATGVGGILRDIIAQGARPVAVMDSLCFGEPDSRRNRSLRDGVVAGIAGYGNAFGVANIGGRTVYDSRYDGNPLVNALAVGLLRPDAMRTAAARGEGNAVLYVGATTGRDGILGAAFASEELSDTPQESRSHIQVGDPFAGKRLLEACLSFSEDLGLVACQDLGASGISCAAFEMAALGGVGMELNLEAVPLREPGLSAHEILVSESQERFLFVVDKTREDAAVAHFRDAGVHAAIIGRITAGKRVRATFKGNTVVDLPAKLVADDAPLCNWPVASSLQPAADYPSFDCPEDMTDTLLALLSRPNIANHDVIYQCYDQTVGNRTVRGPGTAAAAVQKLPGSKRGYALCITGHGDHCGADPYLGAKAALGEAMRRLACVGATMVAITDGLNCGSPRHAEENRRLERIIAGLADGLRELDVPVTGGNVSLYNESSHGAIPPTPMVGALGIVEDVTQVPHNVLQHGQTLFLLGAPLSAPVCSEYGRMQTDKPSHGKVHVDLLAEMHLAQFLREQIQAGLVQSCAPSGTGGVGVALAKMCIRGDIGATVELSPSARPDWQLFGEYAARVWVGVPDDKLEVFTRNIEKANMGWLQAGKPGGDALCISGQGNTLLRATLHQLNEAFA